MKSGKALCIDSASRTSRRAASSLRRKVPGSSTTRSMPWTSEVGTPMNPMSWWSGRVMRPAWPGFMPATSRIASMLPSTARWLSGMGRGMPAEPLVYWMKARSSGSPGAGPGASCGDLH